MVTKRDALAYQISSLPLSYVPKIEDYLPELQTEEPEFTHHIKVFSEAKIVSIKEPKLSQWDYLDQDKIEELLKLKTSKEMYEFIDPTLKNYRKGRPKDMFIQLLSDVTKFCQNYGHNVEKTAAVLSQFYQTHIYFTSGLDITAEKVYIYFKELMMCHSLPFPPSKKKIFDIKEATDILEFFFKIYLRNLPLIKYLCTPNYALLFNYVIPPPPVFHSKEKGKKGKKGKEKKGKDKKKKKK